MNSYEPFSNSFIDNYPSNSTSPPAGTLLQAYWDSTCEEPGLRTSSACHKSLSNLLCVYVSVGLRVNSCTPIHVTWPPKIHDILKFEHQDQPCENMIYGWTYYIQIV